jgi:serine/threonine-protein kinase
MTEETIFAVALEKCTPAEREAYLDEACAGDAELRRQVEALLKSHTAAGQFLAVPAAAQVAAGCRPAGESTDAIDPSAPAEPNDAQALPVENPPSCGAGCRPGPNTGV